MSSEDAPPPVSDAKAKAAARQAKLLQKGKERLAKITANGDGRVISDAAVGIPRRPTTAPSSDLMLSGASSPPTGHLAAALAGDEDPAEIDLALSESAAPPPFNPFAAFGLPPGGGGLGPDASGGDPFAQLFQQLGAGAGGPPGSGATGLPTAPLSPFPPARRTRLDRLFPIVHVLAMVALAAYAIGWLEPSRRLGIAGWTGRRGEVDWKAWSGLQYRPVGQTWRLVGGTGLAEVPLLWMFVTVELVLQTTRLFLIRNQVPASGILNTILPLLQQFSPGLALLVSTAQWYLQLLSILLNDFAVLIFCIGVAAMFGRWREGNVGPGMTGVVEGVLDGAIGGAGWNAARNEL